MENQQIQQLNASANTITPYVLPEKKKIVQVSSGDSMSLFRTEDNEVFHFQSRSTTGKKLALQDIEDLSCGYIHSLLLNSKGEPFFIGTDNYGQSGENRSNTTPFRMKWFENKKLTIKNVQCGCYQSYLLTDDDVLYATGYNERKELGYQTKTHQKTPVLITEGVTRYWTGNYSFEVYIEKGSEITGYGESIQNNQQVLSNLVGLKGKTIIDLSAGYQNVLLLVEGQIGNEVYRYRSGTVKKLQYFDKKFPTVISNGCHHSLVRLQNGEVHGWDRSYDESIQIHKSSLKELDSPQQWKIVCGAWFSVVLPSIESTPISEDFKLMYEQKELTDLKIFGLDAHSSVLSAKLNRDAEDIKNYLLENSSKEEVEIFLEWIYCDTVSNQDVISKIALNFGIQEIKTVNWKNTLQRIFHDDDSKDFNIRVKLDEEEDDEEDEFEEIPVHKFLLQARCGLFRNMFLEIEENAKYVTDFSGRALETVECFIQYLYLNEIALTADDDPELIIEELPEAGEYYQIYNVNGLNALVKKLQKQYNK
ncbi:hypothetical protein M0812_11300 [Anaeramoeba flamelloides]|uniref:BTB domain-containing protein n=1 Tax=Anaeramoeba flamelloides TaxID=1746091 RepID=A0AAV7ZTU3_9EUKA|nr:hypothetical protein M0812_11300 [Anaeramoeba flamelloides]